MDGDQSLMATPSTTNSPSSELSKSRVEAISSSDQSLKLEDAIASLKKKL